jgi:tetratricopeptide (TPR) repeat protein
MGAHTIPHIQEGFMSQQPAGVRPRLAVLTLAAVVASYGSAPAQSAGTSGKIPVTTSSNDAKQQYLKGRTLAENLRGQDSREFLSQAVSHDPSMALAHYSLALSAPTAKDFFQHLKQAVALADRASDGERLMILGLEAGANADTRLQRDYYERLAAAYPRDERAHFLLGGAYFGQQNYAKAIGEYEKAVEIAADYAPAYNLLGYARRANGQFDQAEAAFKKYIALIPSDPNPYDSYAELLMKMGRFDESIAMYRKALSVNAHFAPSRFGIASNLMFQGKHDQARSELWKLHQAARNDGERRTALFGAAVVYADEGKLDQALGELKKEYAVADKIDDDAAMAADLVAMGDVALEAGRADDARKFYLSSLEKQEKSDLSSAVKEDARLTHHYNLGRVALRAGDLASAQEHARAFLSGTTAKNNNGEMLQAHALVGAIALQGKNYDQALAELNQANQQDPYTLYRIGLAYLGKGDQTRAGEFFQKAANQNTLPTLNSAFVRAKAKRMKA